MVTTGTDGIRVLHLSSAADAAAPSSLVVVHDSERGSGGAAWIAHWGERLASAPPASLVTDAAIGPSVIDAGVRLTVLAGADDGWFGRPAIDLRRPGRPHVPGGRLRFAFDVSAHVTHDSGNAGGEIVVTHEDCAAGVRITSRLRLDPSSGMLRVDHVVRNTGDRPLAVDALATILPVPTRAGEVLDVGGRWCRERVPQRHPLPFGTWLRSSRHGRPGHDAPLLFALGVPGFGHRRGEVWAVHLGWSGDSDVWAERVPQGRAVLGAAEGLAADEILLEHGQSYTSPVAYAAYSSAGIDVVTAAFHSWLRARSSHPAGPRPIVANAWEAVGLTHDEGVLRSAADDAARLGAELFMLDDGWFPRRRTDTAGLGDWIVDPEVWPGGLRGFADHVHGLGMRFGLWFEPEMISLDSDLARAHPDWVSAPSGGDGGGPDVPPWRHQQTVDLANPDAYRHVLDAMSVVIDEVGVDLVKWDQNRDPVVRRQHAHTAAVYRMMDELRARHPGLMIESCSAGGARIDLGMLEHCDRVWPTDTNDAVERARLQWWTATIVPPELVGTQIGAADAVHTTGRAHVLESRGVVALLGHPGFEHGAERERDGTLRLRDLAEWIELAKRLQPLVTTGTLVHADLPDPAHLLQGVVAADGGEAWFTLFAADVAADDVPAPMPLPGLDPDAVYRVLCVAPADRRHGFALARTEPAWMGTGLAASGAQLDVLGLPMPALNPERGLLLHVVRE